ncbi:MAG: hypothetical protein KGO96_08695 [Elusimicrobia bacterium]|nr:hypothetical protein [Elusimicrobiota bacterium]MDE2425967.1 hypothetical protein [Elusimicrobiota bacterium]
MRERMLGRLSGVALTLLRGMRRRLASGGGGLPRARLLDLLGRASLGLGLEPEERFGEAILCFGAAAAIYMRKEEIDAWARQRCKQGEACRRLAGAGFPKAWEDAVFHYEAALVVLTRRQVPALYADALENLAIAYRELPSKDRKASTLKAIDCYRRALRVFTFQLMPLKNARLHDGLGSAFLGLCAGAARPQQNACRALRHFERALRVRSKSRYPCEYAATQLNRAGGYLQLASCQPDPRETTRLARICLQEARDGFMRCGQAGRAAQVERRLEALGASS